MAQLPPKAPTPATWSNFGHQRPATTMASFLPTSTPTVTTHHPSWVDDFLDFSSTRRGSHRRSVSDSVAFLELPQMDDDDDGDDDCGPDHDFDRLDDDQLISMFSDDVPPSSAIPVPVSSAPSTPSDQNSINENNLSDQPAANELGEAQSACKTEPQATDPMVFDPKRVKRIIANRQSAQRSRVRKLQYISELERNVTTLQTEVSVLSPRVAFLDHQRTILTVGNGHLKQRIAALAQERIFKDDRGIGLVSPSCVPRSPAHNSDGGQRPSKAADRGSRAGKDLQGCLHAAHQEALKEEIERLRHVYQQQNLKNMANPTSEDGDMRNNSEPLHS